MDSARLELEVRRHDVVTPSAGALPPGTDSLGCAARPGRRLARRRQVALQRWWRQVDDAVAVPVVLGAVVLDHSLLRYFVGAGEVEWTRQRLRIGDREVDLH